MNLIDTGIEKELIKFDEDRNFITYHHQNEKRKYRGEGLGSRFKLQS